MSEPDLIHKLSADIMYRRHEILNDFAKAYLAEKIMNGEEVVIADLCLVEQWNDGSVSWHFQKNDNSKI